MDISALQTYYAFVQSVSFDPFGSGRRDHVAYVGLDKSDKQVYLHIYDTRTGEYKGKQWVGEMNWMFDNKGLIRALNLETNAYLNITAGDFDGDGKDTLIIYVPHTKRSTGLMQTFDYEPFVGCFLYEYSFTGKNSFVLLNNTSIMGEGKNSASAMICFMTPTKNYITPLLEVPRTQGQMVTAWVEALAQPLTTDFISWA